ncbi:MAG: hypothetical protein WB441_05590 [Nocardioidaceae bacterium]
METGSAAGPKRWSDTESVGAPAGDGHEPGDLPEEVLAPPRRRFWLAELPRFEFLFRRAVTTAFWDLGGGWRVGLVRTVAGPGPDSRLVVLGPDDTADSAALTWYVGGTSRERASRVRALDALLADAAAARVAKVRRGCMVDGVWWEIEEFRDDNAGLVTAEVFPEIADGWRAFEPPAWAGREVTADPRFGDGALARRPFGHWTEAERVQQPT